MLERKVFWTKAAQIDLEGIVDHIADDAPHNALEIFDRLQARAAALNLHTLRGRRVPELRGLDVSGYREIIDSPWRIIYRVADERVYVLAVLDARRDLTTLLLERLLRLT